MALFISSIKIPGVSSQRPWNLLCNLSLTDRPTLFGMMGYRDTTALLNEPWVNSHLIITWTYVLSEIHLVGRLIFATWSTFWHFPGGVCCDRSLHGRGCCTRIWTFTCMWRDAFEVCVVWNEEHCLPVSLAAYRNSTKSHGRNSFLGSK